MRGALVDLLEFQNYDVLIAANGRDAIDHLPRLKSPCVIVLDSIMPIMNGLEFVTFLRSAQPFAHLPVIAFSAMDWIGPIINGPDEQLKKPVTLEALLAAVERNCR